MCSPESSVRVLIIEDTPDIQDLLDTVLQEEGFATLLANNGAIGVDLAKQQIPDLIICDLLMPELDGYGVLRAVRQDPQISKIPVIILTALSDQVSMDWVKQLGGDAYVCKPFKRDELLGVIHQVLGE